MIGFLTGKIHSKDDTRAVIDVNGVGYEVFLPKNTLMILGEVGTPVRLEIYTHINENAFALYGFSKPREKQIFQKLISVSGIGPKLGLAILSSMPLNDLLKAVGQGNLAVLTSISGVGKKTAERLLVELRDKFKEEEAVLKAGAANDDQGHDPRLRDVTSALLSLGYAENQAKRVVNGLDVGDEDTVQSLIKKSLMEMQR